MKGCIFRCPTCNNTYNETTMKPLLLPCGHVYCYQCITNTLQNNEVVCPADSIQHHVSISKLPVCSPIISNLPNDDVSMMSCKIHSNKAIKYFCEKHCEYLCTQCLTTHIGFGHHVVTFHPDFEDMKRKIELINSKIKDLTNTLNISDEDQAYSNNRLLENYYLQENSINKAYDYSLKLLAEKKEQLLDKYKHLYDEQKKSIIAQLAQTTSVTEKLNKISEIIAKLNAGDNKDYGDFINTLNSINEEIAECEGQMPQPSIKIPAFEDKVNVDDESDIKYINPDEGKKNPLFTQIRNQPSSKMGIYTQHKKTKLDASYLVARSPLIKENN